VDLHVDINSSINLIFNGESNVTYSNSDVYVSNKSTTIQSYNTANYDNNFYGVFSGKTSKDTVSLNVRNKLSNDQVKYLNFCLVSQKSGFMLTN